MTQDINYTTKTKQLIDNLKSVCANYGLGNDGNEFKIISQVFLYKFLNDKFRYEVKKKREELGQDLEEDLLMDFLDFPLYGFKVCLFSLYVLIVFRDFFDGCVRYHDSFCDLEED